MKFAKIVFWIAGVWGLLVITPLYFMFNLIGEKDPPPITHPGFFYGFVGCALALAMVAFLFCSHAIPFALSPARNDSFHSREKATYALAIVILVLQSRTLNPHDLIFAATDARFSGLLFMRQLTLQKRPRSPNLLGVETPMP